MSRQIVSDNIPYGTYVVKVTEGEHAGKYIADDEQNYLSVTCDRNNAKACRALIEAARSYGFPHVTLEFREGSRQIRDEEYEEQKQRMSMGLVPDKWDIGNALDEYKDGPNRQ